MQQTLTPSLIKTLGEGTCLIILVCFFLQGVIKKNHELAKTKKNLQQAFDVAQHSDKAKEIFLKSVRKDLKVPFITIVTYTEILLKQLRGEINLELSREKQIDFLNRIAQACQDLETLTTQVVDFAAKDIKVLLEDCLMIMSKEAFVKGVTLESPIGQLPKWNMDELRFKQIVVGLISHSLQFCRNGNFLVVKACIEEGEKSSFLKISIKDNGLGLNEEDRHRIQVLHQGNIRISQFTDGTSLELASIQRLVSLLKGTLQISSTWRVGTEITLLFPYRILEEQNVDSKNAALEKSSVILCDWGPE